ncbi:hypothetical protein ACFV0Y_16635 [Streptomyces sp. NPDC059569]|uniref:hypothetical protein n=1 Tax=Streptomyces sp. NPDC059569 TaxID=3346869 RepID=UPI0036A6C732
MSLTLITHPSDAEIAEAEADVRAGIVTDYLAAKRTNHRAGIARALFAAMSLDAASPDEPAVMDEIDAIRWSVAAA